MTNNEQKLIDGIMRTNPEFWETPSGSNTWTCPFCAKMTTTKISGSYLELGEIKHEKDCTYLFAKKLKEQSAQKRRPFIIHYGGIRKMKYAYDIYDLLSNLGKDFKERWENIEWEDPEYPKKALSLDREWWNEENHVADHLQDQIETWRENRRDDDETPYYYTGSGWPLKQKFLW